MNKSFLILITTALMVSFTGCMTYPLNHSEIPRRITHFEGFELKPNMKIDIQSRNVYTGDWETIVTTRSRYRVAGGVPIIDPATGMEFFRWETRRVRIPRQYWEAVPYGNGLKCQIRGVREDGRLIETYNVAPDWSGKGALEDFGENGNPEEFITLWSY